MRSFPLKLYRALSRLHTPADAAGPALPANRELRSVPRPTVYADEPTVYADAPLTRLLVAIDRRASDVESALADYARARRAAGVLPEAVLIEFKRFLRRAMGIERAQPRLTGRLIELYFAG